MGFEGRLYEAKWPDYDESKCKEDNIEIIVQVNGKLKDKLTIKSGASKDDMLKAVLELEKVKSSIEGLSIVKEIVIPEKLVNIVVK